MLKQLYLVVAALLVVTTAQAQKAYIEPGGADFDPTQEVTLFVDLNQTECQRLLDADQVYLWTWMPAEPVIGNGDWTNSNPDMAMTDEGNGVWSFTFVPTEFYGVSAEEVYANDFSFLAKALDGTGEGGGGCDEDKTEDLSIAVEPPVLVRKVFSFPDVVDGDTLATSNADFFSIVYDNNLETSTPIIGADDFYAFPRAIGDDGNTYPYVQFGQVFDTPELQFRNDGGGKFSWTVVPTEFFADVVPDGVRIVGVESRIVKANAGSSAEIVNQGEFFDFFFTCF